MNIKGFAWNQPCPFAHCYALKTNFNTSLSLMANSGGLPWVIKTQQWQEQHYPFLSVCVVFLRFQTTVWLPALGIFNMSTDVDACHRAHGLCGHHKRVCVES